MDWGTFLQWAIDHLDELPTLIKEAREVWDAFDDQGVAAGLAELAQLIALLAELATDFPTVITFEEADYGAQLLKVEAQGISIGDLIKLYQIIKVVTDLLRGGK